MGEMGWVGEKQNLEPGEGLQGEREETAEEALLPSRLLQAQGRLRRILRVDNALLLADGAIDRRRRRSARSGRRRRHGFDGREGVGVGGFSLLLREPRHARRVRHELQGLLVLLARGLLCGILCVDDALGGLVEAGRGGAEVVRGHALLHRHAQRRRAVQHQSAGDEEEGEHGARE